MSRFSLLVLLAVAVGLWAVVCSMIYLAYRRAAWLAGATVAQCLFFLGATIAASVMYPRALILLPLWIAVAVLCVIHLRAAAARTVPHPPRAEKIERARSVESFV